MIFSRQIIEKYQGNITVISNQNYNKYLRELIALSPIESTMIVPTKNQKDGTVNRSVLILLTPGKNFCYALC